MFAAPDTSSRERSGGWRFCTSEAAIANASSPAVSIARQNLEPVRDRLPAVDDGASVVRGIHFVAAGARTPGHVGLSNTSDGEPLRFIEPRNPRQNAFDKGVHG